jgi:hypothetical protein
MIAQLIYSFLLLIMEYASLLPLTETCTGMLGSLYKKFILVSMLLAAAGPGKCLINHGGCWHETRNGKTFSACQVGVGLSTEY